ncbi:hypothetical protein [Geotalea sp. SG265]|uniref:hypothetical protein n=1 Tax=Geotalea sp. SG265 TaxID=2922867 RepID=UPI001FAF5226|nr:hypothetical protein [Geotalea sp. SG265]
MTGREAVKTMKERRTENDRFVRYWRKEEDFLDYDLIERFETEGVNADNIGGIDLLTMDDMWSMVKKAVGSRVNLVHEAGGDRIRWAHKGKEDVCSYTPENLLTIFDAETRGNPVDS